MQHTLVSCELHIALKEDGRRGEDLNLRGSLNKLKRLGFVLELPLGTAGNDNQGMTGSDRE